MTSTVRKTIVELFGEKHARERCDDLMTPPEERIIQTFSEWERRVTRDAPLLKAIELEYRCLLSHLHYYVHKMKESKKSICNAEPELVDYFKLPMDRFRRKLVRPFFVNEELLNLGEHLRQRVFELNRKVEYVLEWTEGWTLRKTFARHCKKYLSESAWRCLSDIFMEYFEPLQNSSHHPPQMRNWAWFELLKLTDQNDRAIARFTVRLLDATKKGRLGYYLNCKGELPTDVVELVMDPRATPKEIEKLIQNISRPRLRTFAEKWKIIQKAIGVYNLEHSEELGSRNPQRLAGILDIPVDFATKILATIPLGIFQRTTTSRECKMLVALLEGPCDVDGVIAYFGDDEDDFGKAKKCSDVQWQLNKKLKSVGYVIRKSNRCFELKKKSEQP